MIRVLFLRVKCWNEGRECSAVLPAAQVTQHFQHECQHHCIRCPRCSAAVLCTDVCAHLESECSTTVTPDESECEGDSARKVDTALWTSFKQALEMQAGELKALLERHLPGGDHNTDRFSEVVHGLNNCQEALRELTQGISGVKDTVRQEAVQIRTEYRDCVKQFSDEIATFSEKTDDRFSGTNETISNSTRALKKILSDELTNVARGKRDNDPAVSGVSEWTLKQLEAIKDGIGRMTKMLPRLPNLQASECEFVVKGVRSLEEKARKGGSPTYESKYVYIRGYRMAPGVYLECTAGIVQLCACFLLQKGDLDDVIQWPFEQTIKLRVLHPKEPAEREFVERPVGSLSARARPQEGCARYPYLSHQFIFLKELIRDGFVQDDQLRVKFELL